MSEIHTPLSVVFQGAPILSHDYAYCVKRGDGVVAFWVDLDSKYCEVIGYGGDFDGPPEIYLCGNERSLHLHPDHHLADATAITFPEFAGWDVHAVEMSKYTLAVCLTKREPA